jgi:hypothetical protein
MIHHSRGQGLLVLVTRADIAELDVVEASLGHPHRGWAERSDASGFGLRVSEKLVWWDDGDHGAECVHLGTGQPRTGEEHPADDRLADEATEVTGSTVNADTELWETESRVVCGDDEVTRRRQHEAGAQRGARHCTDDRYLAFLDREERLANMKHPLAHVVTVHGREVVEVVAGAEVLPGSREDDRSHTSPDPVYVGEEISDFPVHREVDGIHRWPVESDGCDTAVVEVDAEAREGLVHGLDGTREAAVS